MKKLNCSLLLRLAFSLSLVLFLNLLPLCLLEVHASNPVPNSDYTYDIYYKNDQGAWVSMTANGGVSGLTPNRAYDCRIRINLDTLVGKEKPSNLKLKFNHTKGASTDYRVFLQQADGVYISTPTYSTLLVNHSSSNTVTTVQVFGIESPNYDYLYINFTFALDSYNTTSDPTNGVISIGVSSFTMEDLTLEQQMNIINETINNNGLVINNNLNSIKEQESVFHGEQQTALNNINNNIVDTKEEIESMLSEEYARQQQHRITITSILENVWGFLSGFFTNLEHFFIPSASDFADFLEEQVELLQDDCPLLADFLDVFQGLFDTIASGQQVDHFTIPSFTIPLPDNNVWVFDEINVPLFPSGLNYLLTSVRVFLSIVTSVLVAKMCFSKIFDILGVAQRDNLVDVDSDD